MLEQAPLASYLNVTSAFPALPGSVGLVVAGSSAARPDQLSSAFWLLIATFCTTTVVPSSPLVIDLMFAFEKVVDVPSQVKSSVVASAYAARMLETDTPSRLFSNCVVNTGMATATSTAMIATTISSSASVKPRLLFFFKGHSSSLNVCCEGGSLRRYSGTGCPGNSPSRASISRLPGNSL